jgi:hypothetical protein
VARAFEIHREDGRTGGLKETRTHFLIRRTESENISSEVEEEKSLQFVGGSASPKILASVSSSRPPVLL